MSELHSRVQLTPSSAVVPLALHLARCEAEAKCTVLDAIDTFLALQ